MLSKIQVKNDNLKQRSSNHCRKYLNWSCDISFNCYVAANVCCKDAFQYCFTHHLELAKKSKFKIWPAVNCGVSIAMIPPIQKSPRRGIEPRSPAWQAGILTTILSRMRYGRMSSLLSVYKSNVVKQLSKQLKLLCKDYLW